MPKKRRTRSAKESNDESGRIRYAVIGLGWIAQSAVLPAFAGARRNSRLEALVSDDDTKLKVLGSKYKVTKL